MEFDSNSEFCEIALSIGKKLMRLRERNFAKADAIAEELQPVLLVGDERRHIEVKSTVDDARSEYESYLKILPHGPQAPDAQKAIDRLKTETMALQPPH